MKVDGLVARPTGSETYLVECPYCGRREQIEYHRGALAWVIGHIQAEHTDELPDYEV